MKKLITAIFCLILVSSCNNKENEPREESTPVNQSNYEVASDRYSELNQEALDRMAALDFDAWGEMLADDVQYFFPDGDAETRTILNGKEEVLNWWKDWKNNSGIEKMTFTNPVFIPVKANQKLNYSGLTGVIVLSYFSNEMVFNGQPIGVRMNFATHFNKDSLIDRYYTYYDRTPIINTMNRNILEIVVPKKQ
ncbi:nuclear transport factor 2 family protein [Salinimicrobium soli]|uniref:nuclear transport factor 2 family protein n=1 Tax=Salinimicrobium soli TaxID=1254399 RepID=UPI003AAA2C63